MSNETVYQNNYGHKINIYIENSNVSVSDVSLAKLKVLKPSGVTVDWILSSATDEDGNPCLQYISVEGDFEECGNYKIQPYLELNNSGFKGHTKMFIIPVERTV